MSDDAPRQPPEVVEVPITDELDLHWFRPKDVGPVVRDYLHECAARGITPVRLIHGKGKGVQRRTVQRELERHPKVKSFRLGGSGEGHWGATVAELEV
jgi:dsDNA-specific endonuclease/ATPase MutS2